MKIKVCILTGIALISIIYNNAAICGDNPTSPSTMPTTAEIKQLVNVLSSHKWESPLIREAIIDVANKLERQEFEPILIDGLTDGDKNIRLKSIKALSAILAKDKIAIVAKYINDSDEDIRQAAIGSLASMSGLGAKKYLLTALEGKDDNIKDIVIDELISHKMPLDDDEYKILLSNADEKVRAFAAKIAIATAYKNINIIVSKMLSDESARVRQAALSAIAHVEDKIKYIDQIISMLNDKDGRIKANAIAMMCSIDDPKTNTVIESILKSDDVASRWSIAVGLYNSKNIKRAEYILKLLDDSIPSVRIEALRTLSSFKDNSNLARIVKCTEDKEIDVAYTALRLLKESGYDNISPLIKNVYMRSFGQKKIEIITQYSTVMNADVIKTIVNDALSEKDPSIRVAAICLFGKIDPELLPKIFDKMSKDIEVNVRKELVKYLANSKKTAAIIQGLNILSKDANQEISTAASQALKKYNQ